MSKDLTFVFEPAKGSIFTECKMQLAVITTEPATYDVEMHLIRNTASSNLSLRIVEVRRLDSSTVDSVLDTYIQRLTSKGWRLINDTKS